VPEPMANLRASTSAVRATDLVDATFRSELRELLKNSLRSADPRRTSTCRGQATGSSKDVWGGLDESEQTRRGSWASRQRARSRRRVRAFIADVAASLHSLDAAWDCRRRWSTLRGGSATNRGTRHRDRRSPLRRRVSTAASAQLAASGVMSARQRNVPCSRLGDVSSNCAMAQISKASKHVGRRLQPGSIGKAGPHLPGRRSRAYSTRRASADLRLPAMVPNY